MTMLTMTVVMLMVLVSATVYSHVLNLLLKKN